MSLRLAPSAAHPRSTSNLAARQTGSVPTAAAAPGLPDQLAAAGSIVQPEAVTAPHTFCPPPTSSHPLEARLSHWRATQHELKMTGLRRAYGLAEPVRRGMELNVVRAGEWRPQALGGSAGVSGDVLEGRDTVIDWEDVFRGDEVEGAGVLTEMEARLRMRFS